MEVQIEYGGRIDDDDDDDDDNNRDSSTVDGINIRGEEQQSQGRSWLPKVRYCTYVDADCCSD